MSPAEVTDRLRAIAPRAAAWWTEYVREASDIDRHPDEVLYSFASFVLATPRFSRNHPRIIGSAIRCVGAAVADCAQTGRSQA